MTQAYRGDNAQWNVVGASIYNSPEYDSISLATGWGRYSDNTFEVVRLDLKSYDTDWLTFAFPRELELAPGFRGTNTLSFDVGQNILDDDGYFSHNVGFYGDMYLTKLAARSVPEPASLFLFTLGFAGLGLTRHWRRSRYEEAPTSLNRQTEHVHALLSPSRRSEQASWKTKDRSQMHSELDNSQPHECRTQ